MSQVRLGTSGAGVPAVVVDHVRGVLGLLDDVVAETDAHRTRRGGTDSSYVEAHLRLLRERRARDAPCCGGTPLPTLRICRSRCGWFGVVSTSPLEPSPVLIDARTG